MKNTKNAGDFIFGRNSVTEALKLCPQRINKIIILKSVTNDPKINEIVTLARQNRVVFQFVPKERFANFTEFSHQGIAAYTSPVSYLDIDDFLDSQKQKTGYSKIIILDGVEDPHNVGAIIRTSACAGYDAVIIPSRRNAQVNATVEKTSAGAINHIPIIKVNSLSSTIDKLKDNNYWIIAYLCSR